MAAFEDSELVRRCKEGDMNAFEELVHKYKKRIYYTAYQLTHNHSDADDLSQAAFIKAYQSIHAFREESSFGTWLYRIVVNLSLNHLRCRKNKAELSLNEEIDIEKKAAAGENPGETAEIEELQEKVAGAVEALPEKLKAAVVLVILQGLSHKEAAQILGCAEKTVSWQIHEARKRLKEKLKDYLED